MGTVILKFLAGAVAGLLAWMIMEPSAPKVFPHAGWAQWESTFILLLGALIGLAVGGLEGFTRGGKVHTAKGVVLGLVFGAIGASFGASIATIAVNSVFGGGVFESENLAKTIPARILAFVPIGMFLGAAIGMSSLTFKRAVQGLIGGALGGAIAGMCFDPISTVLGQAMLSAEGQHRGEVGSPGRALTAILMGALIGLFIGLVERFSRSAWLRLSLGRNEGREWSIDGSQTFIGRSESAQVPLFGDANVAPVHASITRQGGNYILTDNGSPAGTFINGQRVGQAVLFNGAQIQIGGFILQFLLKGHAAAQRGPEAYVGTSYPIGGQGAPMANPGYQPQYGQPQPQQMPQPMQQPMQPGMPRGNPTQVMPAPGMNPTVAFASPASQPTGGFVLVAMDGVLLGQRFNVAGPMEVGRECPSIPMSYDTGASRRHAGLTPMFNGIAVSDLGSTNGTFLNGQRVSQAMAAPGDMLKIGSTTFRVETA